MTATNALGSDSRQYDIDIAPAPAPPVITSGNPPAGVQGSAYSFTVTATGVPAPTFTVTAGALPAGLTLDPTTGQISGRPTRAGKFSFTVTATNIAGSTSRRYTMRVASTPEAPTIGGTPPIGTVGTTYRFTIRATGKPAPTFRVTGGSLPPGLTLDRSTGVISGTPSAAGTFTVRVTATNTAGRASTTYQIVIRSGPGQLPDTGAGMLATSAVAGTLLVLLGALLIRPRRRGTRTA